MSDNKYICIHCKCAGAKSLVPYKIIEDRDGNSIKFKGQLCEACFKKLIGPAQNTKDNDKENM